MSHVHLKHFVNFLFITKLLFLIFVPFVSLSPLHIPKDPLSEFISYLSKNGCAIPDNIKSPFDNSSGKNFAFLKSPLKLCGDVKAYDRNGTSFVLCNEIFEGLVNITCTDIIVKSEITCPVSTDICGDFNKLHDFMPKNSRYLGSRLNDDVICHIICTTYDSLCKFLLWNYEVMKKINDESVEMENEDVNAEDGVQPEAVDLEESENNKLNHISEAESNTSVSSNTSSALESSENLLKGSSATISDTKKSVATSIKYTTEGSNSPERLIASTKVSATVNEPSVTSLIEVNTLGLDAQKTNNKEVKSNGSDKSSNITSQLDNDANVIKAQASKNISDLKEAATTKTNAPKINVLNANKKQTNDDNDKIVNAIPDSEIRDNKLEKVSSNKTSDKITSVELDNTVSTKPSLAGDNIHGNGKEMKDHVTSESTNEVSKGNGAESNVSLNPNSEISTKSSVSSSPIPLYNMEDDNGMPQGGKFQDQYNDEENEVDIGNDYPKPEYDGYSPTVKGKDRSSKNSNSINIDKDVVPAVNNVANKNIDFLNDRIPDQDLDKIQINPPFPEQEDSHFFFYFLSVVFMLMAGYLMFHNKQKIIALIVEGRHERRRRSHGVGYKKLETK